jgi:hypothetical protein
MSHGEDKRCVTLMSPFPHLQEPLFSGVHNVGVVGLSPTTDESKRSRQSMLLKSIHISIMLI